MLYNSQNGFSTFNSPNSFRAEQYGYASFLLLDPLPFRCRYQKSNLFYPIEVTREYVEWISALLSAGSSIYLTALLIYNVPYKFPNKKHYRFSSCEGK